MRIKIDFGEIFLIALILFITILWVTSCNPVKQVLRDKAKLDEVAKEVIKAGYCANDTTIIIKSDTLVKIDTLTILEEKPFIEVINDTVYITKWRTNTITKTLTIRDTIKATVVDNARVTILQNELISAKDEAYKWHERANKAFGWLIIVFLCIAAYLYLKRKI